MNNSKRGAIEKTYISKTELEKLKNEIARDYERYGKAPVDSLKLTPSFTGAPWKYDVDETDKTISFYWVNQNKRHKKTEVITQINLFNDEVQKYDGDINKFLQYNYDTTALKVHYAVLYLCTKNNLGYFPYNTNDFLDLLGYARTNQGKFHQAANKNRIENILNTFGNDIRYMITIGDTAKEALRIDGPIILIDPKTHFSKIKQNTTVWSGCRIQYAPELWRQVTQRSPKYFLFDKDFLRLDADRRKLSIYIYPILAWQWQLNGPKITLTLKYILQETGLLKQFTTTGHGAKYIKKLDNELNALLSDGLINDWQKINNGKLYDINKIKYIFEMPEKHVYNFSKKWQNKFLK